MGEYSLQGGALHLVSERFETFHKWKPRAYQGRQLTGKQRQLLYGNALEES
jgi:hypothetical protein